MPMWLLRAVPVLFWGLSFLVSPGGVHADSDPPITIMNALQPKVYNPAYSSHDASHNVMVNVYETLVREGSLSGFSPGLAEKWEISEDNRVFDFWIRDNAAWSDGTPIDAHYVAESFRTLASLPETPNFLDFNDIDISVVQKAEGEEAVRFVLPAPSSQFFIYLTIAPNAVLPIHKKDELDLSDPWQDWSNPHYVFSGPYMIDGATSTDRVLVLTPNPHFYDAGNIQNVGVEFHWLVDEGRGRQSVPAIKSGAADIAFMRTVGLSEFVRESLEAYATRIGPGQVDQLLFNVQSPALSDPEIRRALARVMNLSDEHSFLSTNQLLINDSFFLPTIRNVIGLAPNEPTAERLSESVAEAAAVMRAHGFGPDNPLKLRFAINRSPLHEGMANLMRSRLAQVHVDAEISIRSWAEHLQLLGAGEFDIARYGWVYDIPHPANLLIAFTTGNAYNYSGFSNAQFDEIIDDMDRAHDEARLRELAIAAEEILRAEVPSVPIYHQTDKLLLRLPALHIGDLTFFGILRLEQIHRP